MISSTGRAEKSLAKCVTHSKQVNFCSRIWLFFHLGDGSVSFFFSSPKCVQSKVYGAGAVRGAAVRSV